MRTVLSYPGTMAHAIQAARALFEAGALEAFATAFVFREDGQAATLLRALPSGLCRDLLRRLDRRRVPHLPSRLTVSYPFWEMVRSAVATWGANPVAADLAWDHMAHAFDRRVARRHVPRSEAIEAFEYTALASFRRAQKEGVARILHLPSLDSRAFEDIERREKNAWPELASPYDGYFARKSAARYARRQEEIALADVIIANSGLTKKSHVAAGADPEKVFVVPLGAPPPIVPEAVPPFRRDGPLRILWAGTFSLRKGAPHFVEAWRALRPGRSARATVCGQVTVPPRLTATLPEGMELRGPVSRPALFAAYGAADVLVFPTLSDGFGMVVAEAFSRALPVITTDQAGAACLVTHGRNGFIVPAGDTGALADALRWCLDNRETLHAMRLAALDTARRNQWSSFRRRLIRALDAGLHRAGYAPRYLAVSDPWPTDIWPASAS